MKLVSWNIRGLSSDTKKRSARKLVEKKPDVLLIQESKFETVDKFLVQRLWYDAEFEVAVVGAEGLSGGIVSIWNRNFFKVEEIITNKYFIFTRGIAR